MTDPLLSTDLDIDRIASEFESALRRGEFVRIEDVAEQFPALGVRLVRELLLAEIDFQRAQQRPLDWRSYAKRFPDAIALMHAEGIIASPEAGDTSGNSLVESVVDPDATQPQHVPDSLSLAPLHLSDYSLGARLGGGGQGDVFLAMQRSLGRRVAIKLLNKISVGTAQSEQRLLREARTLAQTSHPQIVTIHGIGRSPSGELFLVMEFVDGRDLAKQIADKPFDCYTAAKITMQIAAAVEHAHSRGVIHRDLKPSNVLWHEVRGPVVTDFGLAKDLRTDHGLTSTDQMMGTPTYMAPEQADRRFGEISPRTDVYGLSATFYALLTGRPPVPPGSLAEVLQRLTSDLPLPDPRHWKPEIPAALSAICSTGLAKQPDRRYASVRDLSRDLQCWLDGKALGASVHPSTIAFQPGEGNAMRREPSPAASLPPTDPENLLHAVWDQLDPELQDAFSLAFNKKRRTGSTRISTRDLFEAMARLGVGPLRDVFAELPAGALPDPVDSNIPMDRSVLGDQPLLSDCVRESLLQFKNRGTSQEKVTPVDLFVDVAKHGHGPSVVRLREHGVDAAAMERIVQKLGLRVIRR